jgi:hypothetical protein
MAVGYKSSSTSPGTADSETVSRSVIVPDGSAADDIAVVSIEMWQGTETDPTVTSPGFSQFINVSTSTGSGFQRLKMYWKRLIAAESDPWLFSWAGAQWNMAHAVLITGAKTTGDPVGSNFNTATGTGTNEPAVSLPTPVGFEPFLLHTVANENTSAQNTQPTSFTEIQDGNYLKSNYRVPGSEGSFSASGGVLSVSTFQIAALVAIEPEPESGEVGALMASISDTARTNMLTDRVLTEPQRLSNTDLMSLVLADGAQTLVTKTDATAAVHLWRYLRTVRDL